MKLFKHVMVLFMVAVLTGAVLTGSAGPVKTFKLSEKDIVNIRETLGDVYSRIPDGFETDKKGFFYFLDRDLKTVTKVDRNTLKIVKTIFKFGEGEYKYFYPDALRVKNGKIFALDTAVPIIHVFDLDGKPLKEIRFESKFDEKNWILKGVAGRYNKFDISSKGEIFVRAYDSKSKTTLQVFDENGKFLRNLLQVTSDIDSDTMKWAAENKFSIHLDNRDNLWILYPKDGNLKKMTPEGNLKSEIDLFKDLPKEERIEDTFFEFGFMADNNTSINSRSNLDFSEFELIDGNRIMVHAGKGFYIYNEPDLKLAAKILTPNGELKWGKFVFEGGKIWTIRGMTTVPGYK